ncbi:cysteine hydrolase [Streptosporangium sp. NBC_01755]|uniref:isochorismatase family protein n=1 Tax=unclassified Streptosporangium TaxID=2632669 RepID=UPI002DD8085E|nr:MULTISPECIES: isochorismatase family protein [unclassified Streptosporangium]WSA28229.1 cysteine hydrolase [Streptosporangium sp. NBC_01810]WSD00294.1 cysteine hydrolase [Streptosporangium sp. NBC_01755]
MTFVEGTTPYPWPWDGGLDPARLALLVVACPLHPGRERPTDADHPAETLAAAVRRAGGRVLSVGVRPPIQMSVRPRPRPVAPGTDDPVLHPGRLIRAAGWDGFHGSRLDAVLRGAQRDLLLIAGCCLETGVHSTMRAANDRGYECLLVTDACTSAEPDLTAAALSTIEMSGGIFGAVGDSGAVVEALHTLMTERTTS